MCECGGMMTQSVRLALAKTELLNRLHRFPHKIDLQTRFRPREYILGYSLAFHPDLTSSSVVYRNLVRYSTDERSSTRLVSRLEFSMVFVWTKKVPFGLLVGVTTESSVFFRMERSIWRSSSRDLGILPVVYSEVGGLRALESR
jgi:hypothetical protein